MLAAIEFDTYRYLSLSSGQQICAHTDLATDLAELADADAPAWERQLAATLDNAREPVEHLCLVLPDGIFDRHRELLSQLRAEALPVLHPLRRSSAIRAGLRLLERTSLVNCAIIDISYTGTSIWEVWGDDIPPGEGFPPLALSTATLVAHAAAALADVAGEREGQSAWTRTWEAVSLLHNPALLTIRGNSGELDTLRDECLANYARECTRELEARYAKVFNGTRTIYLTGSGARLMAPWLFPDRPLRRYTLTAHEAFVGQGAMAALLPFCHNFSQKLRRNRPRVRPCKDRKRE